MRLGTIIGRVTLNQQEPIYNGGRLVIIQPLSREQFTGAPMLPFAKGSSVIAYDPLGTGDGSLVGFTEGAEASQPFEGDAPIDAYVACTINRLLYTPPAS
jgi:microcompartment protein CcmK/EutM